MAFNYQELSALVAAFGEEEAATNKAHGLDDKAGDTPAVPIKPRIFSFKRSEFRVCGVCDQRTVADLNGVACHVGCATDGLAMRWAGVREEPNRHDRKRAEWARVGHPLSRRMAPINWQRS